MVPKTSKIISHVIKKKIIIIIIIIIISSHIIYEITKLTYPHFNPHLTLKNKQNKLLLNHFYVIFRNCQLYVNSLKQNFKCIIFQKGSYYLLTFDSFNKSSYTRNSFPFPPLDVLPIWLNHQWSQNISFP